MGISGQFPDPDNGQFSLLPRARCAGSAALVVLGIVRARRTVQRDGNDYPNAGAQGEQRKDRRKQFQMFHHSISSMVSADRSRYGVIRKYSSCMSASHPLRATRLLLQYRQQSEADQMRNPLLVGPRLFVPELAAEHAGRAERRRQAAPRQGNASKDGCLAE